MFKPSKKGKMSRPEGAGNFDNMDDYNVVNSISTQELTAGTVKYPTADGTNTQILQTDGAGQASWANAGSADNLGNHIATQMLSGSDGYFTGAVSGAGIDATTISGGSIFSGAVAVSTVGHTHAGGVGLWENPAIGVANLISGADLISGAQLEVQGVLSGGSVFSGAVAVSMDGHTHAGSAGLWENPITGVANLISGADLISGAQLEVSGVLSGGSIFSGSDAVLTTEIAGMSGASVDHLAQTTGISGASIEHQANFEIVSGANIHLSGMHLDLSGAAYGISGATVAHYADSSDPHGALITQTELRLTSGAVTGDSIHSGAVYIAPIIFSGAGDAPTASDYPMGTIFVGYTA